MSIFAASPTQTLSDQDVTVASLCIGSRTFSPSCSVHWNR